MWTYNGHPAPYPSLAVRARNGRFADNPPIADAKRVFKEQSGRNDGIPRSCSPRYFSLVS
jgi:hypothetical protein